MQGQPYPKLQENVIYRPKDQLQLIDNEVVDNTNPRISTAVLCNAFRKFGLYVHIDSTSSPDLLQVEVEFQERWTNVWHTFKQGPFAALFWEDVDTASGIWECFVGDVLGRAIRVKITGANVATSGNLLSSTKYFTVSVGLDLWN